MNAGDLVGPYLLDRRVGIGGLGEVWLANGPDGAVALKVIRPELADRAGFRDRLAAEAAAAQQAAGPGVVRLLDVETEGPTPYLVMEYLDYPDLAATVAFRGPLTGLELETFSSTLLEAVARIHRADIVHRDLKPTNVLVSADGAAHVLDFGIATSVADAADLPESIGTVGWRAPEVQRGEPVTVAADVFGWGLLVAYAATGRHPFERDDKTDPAELQRGIAFESPTIGGLPSGLRERVREALAADPLRRRHAYVPTAFPANPTEAPETALPSSTLPGSRQPGSRQPGSRQPGSRQPGSRQPGSRQRQGPTQQWKHRRRILGAIAALSVVAIVAIAAVWRPGVRTPVGTTSAAGSPGSVVMGIYLFGGRSIDEIPAGKLTHLVYGFVPVSTLGVKPTGPDSYRRDIGRLTELRRRDPKLRTILGLGGDTKELSAASAPTEVAATVSALVKNMVDDGFDGIDLSWRSPTPGTDEPVRLVALMRALRAELDRQGAASSRRYTLGLHASWLVDDPFNVSGKDQTPPELADVVDFWELDADPMRGPWNCTGDASGGGTGFQSPLRPRAGDGFANNGIEPAVEGWRRVGVPSAKIVLMVPFHGRAFADVPPGPTGDGLGQPCRNTGTTIEDRELITDEVRRAAGGPGPNDHYDEASAAAYRYDPAQKVFVTFESSQSIEAKRTYVAAQGLAGMGAWDLSQDTVDFALLRALCKCG